MIFPLNPESLQGKGFRNLTLGLGMNKKIKKVTIITLTYNNSDLLDSAFMSIERQLVPSEYFIEYILVDDGSTVFSYDSVKRKLDKLSIKTKILVNEQNLGTVKSFNRAIMESSGDIIIPLSADDYFYDENVVRDIIDRFEIDSAMVITGVQVCGNSELPIKEDREILISQGELLRRLSKYDNFISGASTYYNREVFNKIGFFDESYRLLEDYPFYIKCIENDIAIEFFSRKVIVYGVNGVSSASGLNPYLKKDYYKIRLYLSEHPKLTEGDRRYIKYRRLLGRSEKFEIRNILRFPEQFLIYTVSHLIRKIMRFFF